MKPKRPESVPDDAATRMMEAADRMFTYILKRAKEGDVEAQAVLANIFTPIAKKAEPSRKKKGKKYEAGRRGGRFF